MQTDQEIMDKVQAIRDKTGHTISFGMEFQAYGSGFNDLMYHVWNEGLDPYERLSEFPTREALVAHLNKVLEGL
jgi:hypothetical protein